jgi:hypothetical protein
MAFIKGDVCRSMASINKTHIDPPETATRADIFDDSEMLRTKHRCLLEQSFG